jgi:hypothetical protein
VLKDLLRLVRESLEKLMQPITTPLAEALDPQRVEGRVEALVADGLSLPDAIAQAALDADALMDWTFLKTVFGTTGAAVAAVLEMLDGPLAVAEAIVVVLRRAESDVPGDVAHQLRAARVKRRVILRAPNDPSADMTGATTVRRRGT